MRYLNNYKICILLFFLIAITACKEEDNHQDELIERLIEKTSIPLKNFKYIDVNCENTSELLVEIFNEDQDVRNTGTKDREQIDFINLQTFVSLVEKCGFPTKKDFTNYKSKYAVFVVLQHTQREWIAYYFKDFKKATQSGAIEKKYLAYLKDRFLLLHNKPQIYGTQLQNGKLYKLYDPENVEKRREKMEFDESLETYLEDHGLDYETEISKYL
ncbi:hypothetical protein [Mesonia maritima]|uniref:Lipoprotein n=1 Tax=Mesonia maritima TaxID=1793873 RepID=A0ABU1K7Q5_9FLAO|nr:hypothetical protein [Mesonia maritima]MDR6301653.1 hypothetical protein [Mesonia maritima]